MHHVQRSDQRRQAALLCPSLPNASAGFRSHGRDYPEGKEASGNPWRLHVWRQRSRRRQRDLCAQREQGNIRAPQYRRAKVSKAQDTARLDAERLVYTALRYQGQVARSLFSDHPSEAADLSLFLVSVTQLTRARALNSKSPSIGIIKHETVNNQPFFQYTPMDSHGYVNDLVYVRSLGRENKNRHSAGQP